MLRAVFVISLALVINLFPQFITTYSTESDRKTGSFAVTIGTSADEVCSGFQQTSNGGYIIGTGNRLIKLDKSAVTEWYQDYDESWGLMDFGDVKQKPDKGFIAVYYVSTGNGHNSYYMLTDSVGCVQKRGYLEQKEYTNDILRSVELTADGGFVFPGYYSGMYSYSYLIKVGGSNNFDVEVGGEYDAGATRTVCQTADNGYLCAGSSALNKINSLGTFEWSKSLSVMGRDIKMTTDGGYIIVGNVYIGVYPSGFNDIKLVKTDINGSELWSKTFGGTNDDMGNTVVETSDGGYFITGTTKSFGAGGQDIWIIKTDADGNEEWNKTFGGTADESVYSGQQTTDGGYAIGGTTASFGAGGQDIWIIKTDETGTLIEDTSVPLTTELYQNYPNPFNPDTKISFSIPAAQDVKLSVYNSNGQLVNELVNKKMTGGNHSVHFNGSDLNSGIYFYKLETGNSKLTRKMLLIK